MNKKLHNKKAMQVSMHRKNKIAITFRLRKENQVYASLISENAEITY